MYLPKYPPQPEEAILAAKRVLPVAFGRVMPAEDGRAVVKEKWLFNDLAKMGIPCTRSATQSIVTSKRGG